MKQSIQAASIVSVETVIAVFQCRIIPTVMLQAWVLNNTTVIDHCVYNSNSKTTIMLSTMKQSIQAASIVSVETVIAVFQCRIIPTVCYKHGSCWIINTVIDHCGYNSKSKTTIMLSTMKQSIQASSIVSVETVNAAFYCRIIPTVCYKHGSLIILQSSTTVSQLQQ